MNSDRIKQLQKFMEDDPGDPFPKYALAIEHLREDRLKSLELFENLLKDHPEYTATYYHAAALYAELGKREKAEKTYETGISIAKAQNEAHTFRELQSAYLNFQFEV